MCEECPGYPTKCSVCGYENHLIASEICSSCVTAIKHEQERIIKLLREKARHLKQVSESIAMDDYMSDEDAAVPENGAFALNEFADALIRGEK